MSVDPAGRALLVDYGGVLTGGLGTVFTRFEREEGLPSGTLREVLVAAYRSPGAGGDDGLVARIERGEVSNEAFERSLADAFAAAGHEVEADGLRDRMFGDMTPAGRMWDVVAQAREAGVVTCLLSNSWGSGGYPLERLRGVFDHLVLSGEVGMRKPDSDIFEHAAGLVERPLEACAFVDDLRQNVEAAASYGLHAVLHDGDATATAAALSPFLGVELTLADA